MLVQGTVARVAGHWFLWELEVAMLAVVVTGSLPRGPMLSEAPPNRLLVFVPPVPSPSNAVELCRLVV